MSRAESRRRKESSFGKMETTLMRRLSWRLRFSIELLVRSLFRTGSGWSRTVRPSGMFCSSQSARGPFFAVRLDEFGEQSVCFRAISGLEDSSGIGGDSLVHVLGGDMGGEVLLEVELAALPGHAVEDCRPCLLEPFMRVAGDHARMSETAFAERGEELAPVDLGLGERDGASEHDAPARPGRDPEGNESRTGANMVIDTDLGVGGVEDEEGDLLLDGPGAPGLEHLVEFLVGPADFARGDLEAAELFHDCGDFSGGDALKIHLGDGCPEGDFRTLTALQGRRVERSGGVPDLRNLDNAFTEPGTDGLGFEAVGVSIALRRPLMRGGTEMPGALDDHGLLEEEIDGIGEAVDAEFEDEVDRFFKGGMLVVVVFGHGCHVS